MMSTNPQASLVLPQVLEPLLNQRLVLLAEPLNRLSEQLTPEQQQQTAEVLVLSDFIFERVRARPELLAQLWAEALSQPGLAVDRLRPRLQQALLAAQTEAELWRELRLFREFYQLVLVWRDLLGQVELAQVLLFASELAEVCVDEAAKWLYAFEARRVGTPCNALAEPQPLLVLGMGKLGGRELNVSSDIDLIFVYPQQGETMGASRAIANEVFFARLGQKLIAALSQTTADGQPFRVDMRLRPYGDSGRLAMSFSGMQEYYFHIGRDWERYAMVKARVISGPAAAAAQLMSLLKPFVYRRYLDFSAIDSLRQMKALIEREVLRKSRIDNIKLSAGGIREVEFIAQVFQIIRGGVETELQEPSLIKTLQLLAARAELPQAVVDELLVAYGFLRKLEHALQELADQQTQTLPVDELNRARLAWIMRKPDWASLYQHIQWVMHGVHQHFKALIAPPKDKDNEPALAGAVPILEALWQTPLQPQDAEQLELLQRSGFCLAQPDEFLSQLIYLQAQVHNRPLGERGRERFNRLMPQILAGLLQCKQALLLLTRLVPLLDAILCRTTYIELLLEHPVALKNLLLLCEASPWISQLLASHPILLDELLDSRQLRVSPTQAEMRSELSQILLRIPSDDLEQQMEALRQFKQAHQLRIAAEDLLAQLPLMRVSDQLTFLAETLLVESIQLVWQQLTARHGVPADLELASTDQLAGFVVIAYGKLGGIELGYGSDLDLVFIHEGALDTETTGPKPIPTQVFFVKLAQKLIHLISTRTHSGWLYEVDTRLRPSGSSGLLVSHMDSFERYQVQDAWTWEHQALVRARAIAGDPKLQQRFELVRQRVLAQPRDPAQLGQQVLEMRTKMAEHLANKDKTQFHLKQDRGGITDIEFLVQHQVLAHACQYPALLSWTDNVRLLRVLAECGLLNSADAEALIAAYLALRNQAHKLSLQNLPPLVLAEDYLTERALVRRLWQQILEQPVEP